MIKLNYISEIYLANNKISKNEWQELINTISNYVGTLRKWSIIIINNKNKIKYFIKTECTLPPTINNLNSFLLKKIEKKPEIINIRKPTITYPFFLKIGSNFIDVLNYCEIKNKGNLEYLEIIFQKLYEDRIINKTKFILNKNGIIKKYRLFFNIPTSLLTIDFEGNKRYFYESVPKYLDISKILHLLDSDKSSSILQVDTFPYLQGEFYIKQNSYNFDKHSVIIGSSGSGKSKFISLFINNIYKSIDLKSKYKIVIIDPHTSLENDIGGISKVIDFNTPLDSIDLFINKNTDIISSTELLVELLKSLIKDQYNSKLERVLRHSIILLLTNESFNFNNLRKLLLDLEYRNSLIKKLKLILPISVINFFLTDYNDLKTKSYGEAISPIISFIDEMEMLPIFNKTNDKENLKNTINNNFITLFSLDRTKIGDKVTKTLSGLIMQQLLNIIQERNINEHIIFIIDEVAVVENPILTRFLSESRKYNLSLILVGQYFNQISNNLKNAIFANVINYYIFRVSKLDANVLVDNFNMKIPLDNTRDEKIKLLTELHDRECIIRLNTNSILLPAFKATTLNFTSIPRIKNNLSNQTNKIKPKEYKQNNFKINNISLKDILIQNSTSRKVVKNNE